MKKSLAILLTLIFTFSCFSILGIGTVLAETEKIKKVILESDFDNSDGTNWQMSAGAVTYSDDNGDGVNDYARVKISSTDKGVGLFSAPFNLIPGNEYELTYYIRVPKESYTFMVGSIFYAPTTAFYQPKVNDAGTKVSSPPSVSTVEADNNYYAYSYTDDADATKNWSRRKGFAATWTIDGYAAKNRTNFSNFDYRDYGSVLSATNTDLNAAFANWTKVTATFKALAATVGETSQVTALGFSFQDLRSSNNMVFDIKDVKLIENPNGVSDSEEPTPDPEPEEPDDFENLNSLEHYFGVSIRKAEGETKQALRFKFGVPEQVLSEQIVSGYNVVEYGTMVSTVSTNLDYYTGDSAYVTKDGVKTFKAESYNKGTGKNVVFDYCNFTDTDGVHRMTQFTCALNNIGTNAAGETNYAKYDSKLYVRVYIVFANENGETYVYYGATQSASVFAVMKQILNANSNASDVSYVKNFLDGKVAGFEDAEAIKTAWNADSSRTSLYNPA